MNRELGPEVGETPRPATADDVLQCLSGVLSAADLITQSFRHQVPGMGDFHQAPFVLDALAKAGRRGLAQIEIARQLGMSASTATRLIDSLEKSGVVTREMHPNDRRINQIMMSEKGCAIHRLLMQQLTAQSSENGLDANVLNRFSSRLSRISILLP